LDSCQHLEKNGFKVTYLPVTPGGQVRASDVAAAVTDETILISVMHVNNEVGTIQPVAEIGRLAKERGILFHSDGVQSVGKVPWMWKNCTWTVHLQRA
jgi:cysteine desulfurase